MNGASRAKSKLDFGRKYHITRKFLLFDVDCVSIPGRCNTTSVSANSNPSHLPRTLALHQNYPNPFAYSGNGSSSGSPSGTTIRYEIPQTSNSTQHVELSIYNTQGQLVRTLVDATKAPGNYTSTWDVRNARGEHVPSGVYIYRVKAGAWRMARRLVVVRLSLAGRSWISSRTWRIKSH